jgi:hypothetical protein
MRSMRITGWFMAILGAGFLVAGVISFHQGGLGVLLPLTIVGILTLLIGLVMVGVPSAAIEQQAKLARIAATGLAGTASITGLDFSGTVINGERQYRITVNVSLPERLIYQATAIQVIHRTEMSRYACGATFPCRIDPEDLSVVVLIDDTGIARSSSAALASGVPGRATVLGTFNPPPSKLAEPVWGLRIRIEVEDGRPPYEIQMTTVYPAGHQRPHKGTSLPVKINPEEPRQVAIDWPAVPSI